jgi:hypothetical protein
LDESGSVVHEKRNAAIAPVETARANRQKGSSPASPHAREPARLTKSQTAASQGSPPPLRFQQTKTCHRQTRPSRPGSHQTRSTHRWLSGGRRRRQRRRRCWPSLAWGLSCHRCLAAAERARRWETRTLPTVWQMHAVGPLLPIPAPQPVSRPSGVMQPAKTTRTQQQASFKACIWSAMAGFTTAEPAHTASTVKYERGHAWRVFTTAETPNGATHGVLAPN